MNCAERTFQLGGKAMKYKARRAKSEGRKRKWTVMPFALRFLLFVLGLFLSSSAAAQSRGTNLPDGALASFGRQPFHNGSRIHASELSPDGKLLATQSSRSATVWDTATGLPRYRFFFDNSASPGLDSGLSFSPDGKQLACRAASDRIVVWDVLTGQEIRRFPVDSARYGFSFCRFSADGSALIAQHEDEVQWMRIDTGAVVHRLKGMRIKQLSPDDQTFVIVKESQKQVLIGDVVTGKIKHTLPIAARYGREDRGLLFLPDGVTLAIVHHPDDPDKKRDRDRDLAEVQFWDFAAGKRRDMTWNPYQNEKRGFDHIRPALSPDGKVLYQALRRYVLATGAELPPIGGMQSGWTMGTLPHPDGKTVFVIGLEEIHRWDLAAGKEISTYKDFIHWRESAVSSDGRWLALRGYQHNDGTLDLCDTESHRVMRKVVDWGNEPHFVFAPDSQSLVLNHHPYLQFFAVPDLKDGKNLPLPKEHAATEASILFSKDGRYAATRRDTGDLRVFQARTGKIILSQDEIWKALFTPDSTRIVFASRNSDLVSLCDLATKKTIFEIKRPIDRSDGRRGRGAEISDWAFSPNGRTLAVAMTGGHIVLLDAATGKERTRFLSIYTNTFFNSGQHYLHTTALAFSPDGHWLASGGDDGYLRIWDVHMRREIHRLHGHESGTQSLGFSADGRRLVSFGDGEGFVWDLRPKPQDKPAADPFADLVAEDGGTIYRAIWTLANDPRAPALLREKLPPLRLDAGPERIARLVADLDSSNFAVRDKATKSLMALEANTRSALVAALAKNATLETKRRLAGLLELLDGDLPSSQLRIVRAVQAMALHNSDTAQRVLREWSDGTPGLRLTDEARAALARIQATSK
jgi:WD40 repeat protein